MKNPITKKRFIIPHFNLKNYIKSHYKDDHYHSHQGIELELGIICMIVGVVGFWKSDFLGLNLSLMHGLVLVISAVISISSVLTTNKKSKIGIGLGFFFYLNSFLGYFISKNFSEGLFQQQTIDNLNKWMPGFLELTSYDHFFHFIVGTGFILSAIIVRIES